MRISDWSSDVCSSDLFSAMVEEDLDRRIQVFVRSYFGTIEELEAFYKKPLVQIKEDFREQIADGKKAELMQREITAGLDVSPADIREYYHSVPPDSLEIFKDRKSTRLNSSH